MGYYLKSPSSQPSRRTLDIIVPPEDSGRTMQNWSLLVDSGNLSVISLIEDCVLLFSHLALSASYRLAKLNGKRQALCKRIPPHLGACVCPLQGAVSLGTSSGSSAKCLHLTWTKDETDPGAGRPSKRQEDGCALWAQQQPGGKSGDSHGDVRRSL